MVLFSFPKILIVTGRYAMFLQSMFLHDHILRDCLKFAYGDLKIAFHVKAGQNICNR